MAQNPWVGVLLGVVVAGLVHAGKTAARPAANVATFGVGAPVLSTVKDGASLGLSLSPSSAGWWSSRFWRSWGRSAGWRGGADHGVGGGWPGPKDCGRDPVGSRTVRAC